MAALGSGPDLCGPKATHTLITSAASAFLTLHRLPFLPHISSQSQSQLGLSLRITREIPAPQAPVGTGTAQERGSSAGSSAGLPARGQRGC